MTRPSYTRDCREVFDEECEVILEPGSQQQCTMVDQVTSTVMMIMMMIMMMMMMMMITMMDQVEYAEQCSTVYSQECVTVQEKICREPEIVQPPPSDDYGVPKVRPRIEEKGLG